MSAPVRRIWLCADDYGLAPGVSAAIRELIAQGRLNATSVMVLPPSFNAAEAAALAALNAGKRRVAIGLHVTLTAPFRPLSPKYAPLKNGAFFSLPQTFVRAFLRRLDPESLAAEVRAQLDAFVAAFGRLPDFIDGHQHVQVFPQVRDALLAVVAAQAPEAWVRQCGRAAASTRPLSDPKGLILDQLSGQFRARAERRGIRTNPAFAGTYAFTDSADITRLFPGFLDGLPDGGLVMCHPGHVDGELERLDPVTTLREREYAYLAGDGFPGMLAARGAVLA